MSNIINTSLGKTRKVRPRRIWFEKIMALLALINLVLVFFDLSYISGRDLYFHYFRYQNRPILTEFYDPVKGIQSHRETQKYLDTVESLKKIVVSEGLSSQKTQETLKLLRGLSVDMINQNPFALANKTGNLERIKNRLRLRMNSDSAKQAFESFWNQPYLTEENFQKEIGFYDQQIKPLLETNYFRVFAETGYFVDNFWLIDIWFIGIFALEFFITSWLISRRYTGVSWFDGMLWRWYNVFLLIPIWRFLRVISVIIRLNKADLIDLSPIKKQVRQGVAASIAKDISQLVIFEVIDLLQDSIRAGEITKFIYPNKNQNYVDINNINEPVEITKIILRTIIKDSLPHITPDVESLLTYSLEKTLKQNQAYAGISQLPGLDSLQKGISEKIIKETWKTFSDSLNQLIAEDSDFEILLAKLINNFRESLKTELSTTQSLEKIEFLLVDMLEEIKINYIQRLSQKDMDQIIEETRILQQKSQYLTYKKIN